MSRSLSFLALCLGWLLLPAAAAAGDACSYLPTVAPGDAVPQGGVSYLEICSGSDQSAAVNTEFEQPLRLRMMNVPEGQFLIRLQAEVSAGGASALVWDPHAAAWGQTVFVDTDDQGYVQFRLRANGVPGTYAVQACHHGKGACMESATATLTNLAAGQPPLPAFQPVPALDPAGLAGLSVLVLLAGLVLSRRRLPR